MYIRTVRKPAEIDTELLLKKGTAVALGAFDGIHSGHEKLIENVVSKKELFSCVFAFFKSKSETITDNAEREKIFENLGVEFCFFQHFDDEFKNLTPEEFVRVYLKEALFAKNVTVGENYRFGKGGAGDTALLSELCRKYQIEVDVIPMLCDENGELSSTRVREYLKSGNVVMANKLLGRRYSVSGTVKKGRGRGHTFGFPTANIKSEKDCKILYPAVYATAVWVDGEKYPAITNFGTKPTFCEDDVLFETHIIGFSDDLYGREIKIEFIEKIREIQNFKSADELAYQLKKDKETALKIYC